MGQGKKAKNAKDVIFKRLSGVAPKTFEKMKAILQKEYEILHRLGGSTPKLTVEDKLYVTLKYLREYRTMESIGFEYGVSKSTVCESIQWVENSLDKDGSFKLPGKKVLEDAANGIEYIVVDVTESPIQRPKKNQKEWYSGKKNAIR